MQVSLMTRGEIQWPLDHEMLVADMRAGVLWRLQQEASSSSSSFDSSERDWAALLLSLLYEGDDGSAAGPAAEGQVEDEEEIELVANAHGEPMILRGRNWREGIPPHVAQIADAEVHKQTKLVWNMLEGQYYEFGYPPHKQPWVAARRSLAEMYSVQDLGIRRERVPGDGNCFYYAVFGTDDWEEGKKRLLAAGDELLRRGGLLPAMLTRLAQLCPSDRIGDLHLPQDLIQVGLDYHREKYAFAHIEAAHLAAHVFGGAVLIVQRRRLFTGQGEQLKLCTRVPWGMTAQEARTPMWAFWMNHRCILYLPDGQQEEVAQTTEALREAKQRARKVIYYDGWWHFDAGENLPNT